MNDNPNQPDGLPTPNSEGVLAMVAQIKATHRPDDPSNLYYGRHHLVAAENAKLDAFLAQRGIVQPRPPTPAELAAQRVEDAFPSRGREIEPHLQQVIDDDLAALEKLSHEEQERRAHELRAEWGKDYDTLLAQARAAVEPGKWRPATAMSRRALTLLAGVGRYNAAYARAKARLGPG